MNGRDLLVRVATIVILATAVTAGFVLQKPGTEGEVAAFGAAGSTSSAWFCTGLLPRPGRSEVVAVTNPGNESLTGRVTIAGEGKTFKSKSIEVPGLSSVSLNVEEEITPYRAPLEVTESRSAGVVAVVELDAPLAAVGMGTHVTTGAVTDVAVTRCSDALSERFGIAGASSVRGASANLYLANPLGDDAVADISLVTEAGVDVPPKLQKLPVLASSQASYRISEESRRKWTLFVDAKATAGELAGSIEQSSDGTKIGQGIARFSGFSEPSSAWMFPAFSGSDGSSSIIAVSNPLPESRKVEVRVIPDDSIIPTTSALSRPSVLEIGGESAITVTPAPGLGEGSRYSLLVQAPDNRPIMASATVQPRAPGRGLGVSTGYWRAFTRWVLQDPNDLGMPANSKLVVSIMNVSDRDATVRATAFGSGGASAVPGFDSIKVSRDRSVTLDFGSVQLPLAARNVVLDSDTPVVAEAILIVGDNSSPESFDVMPLYPLEVGPARPAAFVQSGIGVPGGASTAIFALSFGVAAVVVFFLDRRAGSRSRSSGGVHDVGRRGASADGLVLKAVIDIARRSELARASVVKAGGAPIFVQFSHGGCRACLATKELLDVIAEEYGGDVVEVEFELDKEAFEAAGVEDVPTTVLVVDSDVKATWVGPLERSLVVRSLSQLVTSRTSSS